jgi:hypothetical protein
MVVISNSKIMVSQSAMTTKEMIEDPKQNMSPPSTTKSYGANLNSSLARTARLPYTSWATMMALKRNGRCTNS